MSIKFLNYFDQKKELHRVKKSNNLIKPNPVCTFLTRLKCRQKNFLF